MPAKYFSDQPLGGGYVKISGHCEGEIIRRVVRLEKLFYVVKLAALRSSWLPITVVGVRVAVGIKILEHQLRMSGRKA